MTDHWTSDPGRGCGLMSLAALAFWIVALAVVFFVWVPSWH